MSRATEIVTLPLQVVYLKTQDQKQISPDLRRVRLDLSKLAQTLSQVHSLFIEGNGFGDLGATNTALVTLISHRLLSRDRLEHSLV